MVIDVMCIQRDGKTDMPEFSCQKSFTLTTLSVLDSEEWKLIFLHLPESYSTGPDIYYAGVVSGGVCALSGLLWFIFFALHKVTWTDTDIEPNCILNIHLFYIKDRL